MSESEAVLITVGPMELLVRELTPSDAPYCLRGAYFEVRTSPTYRRMDGTEYSQTVAEDIRTSLDEAHTALVLCTPDEPWFLVGFAWGDPRIPRIDYLHVRGSYRGQGVATAMAGLLGVVPGLPALITFPTSDLERRGPSRTFPVGLLRSPRWALTMSAPKERE